MPGDLEDEAALYHPGNAVVKSVTVGLDAWEAHELGGKNNTTNINVLIINHMQLRNYFGFFDLSPHGPLFACLEPSRRPRMECDHSVRRNEG
jgi:hypothetical protein